MRTLSLLPIVMLLAVTPCRGQDPARWLADLGGAARGEAAEIALLAMGERAAPLMIAVMKETGDDAGVRRSRQRAALRVLALLGPDAAAVSADLAGVAVDREVLAQRTHTLAALQPWAPATPALFQRLVSDVMFREDIEIGVGCARYMGRTVPAGLATSGLLERLASNRMFEREAVADLLGRRGDRAAVEPLCRMLRARDAVPAGHDLIRHNGFVVPAEDGFRFAASEAVLRLAPDDPRAAVAWSGRARLHPHRTVRRAALASLARYAPDIDDTVPDLLTIARGDDAELAVEAIKLLGMAQSGGAAGLAELERLAAGAAGDVAVRARSLVARLHAAGIVAPVLEAPADPKVATAVAALGQGGDEAALAAAWNEVVADGNAALPLLLERLRIEHEDAPDAVVAAIARIGRDRPEWERADLRDKVHMRFGQTWSAGFTTSHSGSVGRPSTSDQLAYGELVLGGATDAATLAGRLADPNPLVRLAAANRLAEPACSAAVAASTDARDQLIAAARAKHPKQWTFRLPNYGNVENVDLDSAIHVHAATALVACELPADQRAEFLPLLRAGDDVEAIARGLRQWAGPGSLQPLIDALTDDRTKVAIAAAEAIGSLGKDGAPAAKVLQKLARGDRADLAAAAQAALQAVGRWQ